MTAPTTWLRDEGFADFRAGTPGNAGQNIYVSAAGVLQRIHYSCVTGSGFVDLPFANSHDDAPRVPVDLYTGTPRSGSAFQLPTYGAMAGTAPPTAPSPTTRAAASSRPAGSFSTGWRWAP